MHTVRGGGPVLVVRGGCAGGQGRVYWWSGEGVLVVRGGLMVTTTPGLYARSMGKVL